MKLGIQFRFILLIPLVLLLASCNSPGTQVPLEEMPEEVVSIEGTDITEKVVWSPDHLELAELVKKVTVHPIMTYGLFMPNAIFRIDIELNEGCTSVSQSGSFTVSCDGRSTLSFGSEGPMITMNMGAPFYKLGSYESESQIRYVKGE